MSLTTPSPTLYVSNLETKTKKPELRTQLYSLFNPYGRIIDIIAKKHGGGRGQAFVVFAEQAAATSAMRHLSGEMFYNKALQITYSKTPSHATLTLTNPQASRDAQAVKAARLVVSRAQGEYEQLEKEREKEEALQGGDGTAKRELEDGDGGGGKRVKVEHAAADGDGAEDEEMEIEMDVEDDDEQGPSSSAAGSTLVCTNLPPECTPEIMEALFSQYAGFSKVTPLPPSTSLPAGHGEPNPGAKSFSVSFASPEQAQAAVGPTKGFLMQPGWEMGVSVKTG